MKLNDVTMGEDSDVAENMSFTSEDYANIFMYNNVLDRKLSTILCNVNEISQPLKKLNLCSPPVLIRFHRLY